MHFSTKVGKPLESALLESRTLYPKRKLQCLQFFYKMTGSPKDKLVIWVKMDDGTGTIRKMKKIHTFYGRLFFQCHVYGGHTVQLTDSVHALHPNKYLSDYLCCSVKLYSNQNVTRHHKTHINIIRNLLLHLVSFHIMQRILTTHGRSPMSKWK